MRFFSGTDHPSSKENRRSLRSQLYLETLEDRSVPSAAGTIDMNFGIGGIATTDFSPSEFSEPTTDEAYAIAVQPYDGKIVTAGYTFQDSTGWDFAIARYNPDGTLDNSFGPDHNGRVTIDFGSMEDFGGGVTIQPDGKILVVGTRNRETFAVARLNPNGTLDTSFGPDSNGLVSIDIDGVDRDFAYRALLQGDKILITGNFGSYGSGGSGIVRLNREDGSVDSSFGPSGNGQFTIGIYGDAALQPDGKVLLVGENSVVRLTPEGDFDNTFGNLGVQSVAFNAIAVAIGLDGNILVGGRYTLNDQGDFADQDFVVTRLNSVDGSIDTSFGIAGERSIDFGSGHEIALNFAIQPDEKILVTGFTEQPDNFYYGLTRLDKHGDIDTSFGVEGRVLIPLANVADSVASIALQLDGSILVPGGSYQPTTNEDFALVRLHGFTDTDEDGIEDSVDTQPTVFSNDFNDGTTSGTITNRGNQKIKIVDAPNPSDGLKITANFEGGATPATIDVEEGASTLSLNSGDQLIVTHGGVILDVLKGTVEATFVADSGEVATSSIHVGNELTFDPENFTFEAPSTNTQTVQVFVDGNSLNVTPGQAVRPVQIDIKPGDGTNTLNLTSNGKISVAILSTSGFDAHTVNIGSIVFAGAHVVSYSFQDVNGDGLLDLVVQFRIQDTNLRSLYEQLVADDVNEDGVLDSNHQTASIALSGSCQDGTGISGVDSMDLFLSGKALRDLLAELAAAGEI